MESNRQKNPPQPATAAESRGEKHSSPAHNGGTEKKPRIAETAALSNQQAAEGSAPRPNQPPPPPSGLPKNTPLYRLEKHFNDYMRKENSPLLGSWGQYKKMLPERESLHGHRDGNTTKIIAECPFWARQREVKEMARRFEVKPDPARLSIHYLSAPSHSGKTASILVGFLESCESRRDDSKFSYYFYLPFANNLDKHFVYEGNPQKKAGWIREKEGAHFAFQCVEHLLKIGPLAEVRAFRAVPNPEQLPTVRDKAGLIKDLLDNLVSMDNSRILFHVDEHRDMSNDEDFRRGAMEALARCSRAACVATYTDIPWGVAAAGSSKVCRDPVPKPMLDMTQVFHGIPELNILSLLQPGKERAWATLVFRLAFTIRPMMLDLHLGVKNNFLQSFSQQREAKSIEGCLRLCKQPKANATASQKGIATLMAGIEDTGTGLEDIGFKLPPLTVTGVMITATLETLMSRNDPNHHVYVDGRKRFIKAVNEARGSADAFLASTPLEAAYSWSLPCIAIARDFLELGGNSFSLKPKRLRAGRLFGKTDQDVVRYSSIENDFIYYADEGIGKESHPLCDIWFLSNDNELVLIDVTGGIGKTVDDKIAKKKVWLKSAAAQNLQAKGGGVFVVILAPGDERDGMEEGSFCALKGENARLLLGGLAQCWEWFIVPSASQR